MFTNTLVQSNKLLDAMWGNWENGVQKVYDSQLQFGKIQLEAFKKQQELFASLTGNLNQAEQELKNSLNYFTESFKENSKYISNEETARLVENWNEKMADIINRIQQLSATPSRAMLAMVEQSQERVYQTVKNASEEQTKMQTETKELIEKFISQAKESQSKFVELVEGQTKQAIEKIQPKWKNLETQYSKLLKKSKKVMDRPFNEIAIGDKAVFTRIVTDQDILDFAELTEDVNPIHIDKDYAANTMFKGRIAHGMLTAGFISTLIGTILPGKNVIYLSQNCKFTAPVRIGDTIKIEGIITDKRPNKKILTLQTNAYNQKGEMVIEGNAVIMKKEQR